MLKGTDLPIAAPYGSLNARGTFVNGERAPNTCPRPSGSASDGSDFGRWHLERNSLNNPARISENARQDFKQQVQEVRPGKSALTG